MKRFCLFLIGIGAVLWWICDVGLLMEHAVFLTVFFTLALSLSLTALLYAADLEMRVGALEERIEELESRQREKKDTQE